MKQGDIIERYEIQALLGKGGMGEVYAARDPRLGREVAIKRLRSEGDADANARLLREARAAAAFQHPFAVTVFDVGEHGGSPYIVMELIRGTPLRSYVGDRTIPVAQRLRWLIDTAHVLAAAHRIGLVHRDVKPDNLLVCSDRSIKLLDFGIARRLPSQGVVLDGVSGLGTLTQQGIIVGTPRYSAPEQLLGEEVDGRADQFSWAVMAYELLAGVPPWTATDTVGILSQILLGDIPTIRSRVKMRAATSSPDQPTLQDTRLGENVSLASPEGSAVLEPAGEDEASALIIDEVEQVVRRALSRRAAERYPTLDEAADALEPFAAARLPFTSTLSLSGASGKQNATPTPASTPKEVPGEMLTALSSTGAPLDASRTVRTPHPDSLQSPGREELRRRTKLLLLALSALVAFGGLLVVGKRAVVVTPQATTGSAPAPAPLSAIRCQEAVLSGRGGSTDMARAIGIGACARLANELGLDWGASSGAQALEVAAKFGEEQSEVTLAIAGQQEAASGASPLDAIEKAILGLSPRLTPAPLSAAEVNAWGAKDAAGARRIKRAWRKSLLEPLPNMAADIKSLLETDPDSPWSHLFVLFLQPDDVSVQAEERQKVLDRLDRLPKSRAHGLKGGILCGIPPVQLQEGQRLLRLAYSEAPDDADIAGIYGAFVLDDPASLDEGFAVIDQLSTRFPAVSIFGLSRAIKLSQEWGIEGETKYLDRLKSVLPEAQAWSESVRALLYKGRFEEARAAIAFGRRLGGIRKSQSDAFSSVYLESSVELAALEPHRARELSKPLLGSPRPEDIQDAAKILASAYAMEGRISDAESVLLRGAERLRAVGVRQMAASLSLQLLTLRRFLHRAPPPSMDLDVLERELAAETATPLYQCEALVEFALARRRANGSTKKAPLEQALGKIHELAEREGRGDKATSDNLLLRALPLVRALHGDAAAVAQWKELRKASFYVRRMVAFDAALAFEAVGDQEGAKQAYRLAQHPAFTIAFPFPSIAARFRLAKLYRTEKLGDEAGKLDAVVDRLWADADPGVREDVSKLK